MGRPRNPNRDKAFKLFIDSGGKATSAEIAAQLAEKISTINNWRTQDKWKASLGKVGAPYGNKNAIGNSGGGAPLKNANHYIHGLFSKYLPRATVDIMKNTEGMAPIDILYLNIQMKFAAIIRSQKIMFVKNRNDKTIEKVAEQDGKVIGEKWEIQQAWDKQAQFLKAQSVAMGQLTNMIRRYDELLHKDWDLVTEEQRQRIEKIREDVERLKKANGQESESRKKLEDYF